MACNYMYEQIRNKINNKTNQDITYLWRKRQLIQPVEYDTVALYCFRYWTMYNKSLTKVLNNITYSCVYGLFENTYYNFKNINHK